MELYVVLEYGDYNLGAYIGTFMGIYSSYALAEEAAKKLKENFPDCTYEVGLTRINNDPFQPVDFTK